MSQIINITVEGQSFKVRTLNALEVTVDEQQKYYYDRDRQRFTQPLSDPLTQKRAIEIIENYFAKPPKRSRDL
ncbi:hypothetical protein KTO58_12560 [Chitinophaga pendula]|uniref:hypothetical protein n=1 Tax=Chitinophaga TaxID=79328 RepID=UPI000BB097D3|nr:MULTISPECIES: hypothetical protein [Chitinophaga]ASZ12414.1 hypothetical protein CK934_16330 [Chitinophaga sp. MD30]UCJ09989.1 hypothetical protein KTO58_12560 [Chitinophaga pendula]